MKIAIIDDDHINHFILGKVMDRLELNANLIHFYDGLSAIASLENTPMDFLPEIILLDINMPQMDGWTFLEQFGSLNRQGYNPSIYMLSSSNDPRDLRKAAGHRLVTGFLCKPVDPASIKEIISGIDHELAVWPQSKENLIQGSMVNHTNVTTLDLGVKFL